MFKYMRITYPHLGFKVICSAWFVMSYRYMITRIDQKTREINALQGIRANLEDLKSTKP